MKNVSCNSQILVILMMKALGSSETYVDTIATRRNIPEDAILLLNVFHFPSRDGPVYIATGCGVDACGFIPGRIFSEERRLTGM
jgi:hypothetical protein